MDPNLQGAVHGGGGQERRVGAEPHTGHFRSVGRQVGVRVPRLGTEHAAGGAAAGRAEPGNRGVTPPS